MAGAASSWHNRTWTVHREPVICLRCR